MAGTAPQIKMPKLIVAWAFEYDEEGELRPAFEPREMQSEQRAIEQARIFAVQYAGAIAWSREARPDNLARGIATHAKTRQDHVKYGANNGNTVTNGFFKFS